VGSSQLRIGAGKLVVRVLVAESSLTTALGDAGADGSTDRGSTPRTSTKLGCHQHGTQHKCESFPERRSSQMSPTIKEPSAWLPVSMSAAALGLVLGYVAMFGVAGKPSGDEGAATRIFQLHLAGQLPIIGYFGVKWLPKRPKQAVMILGLQISAALVPLILVATLEM